MAQLFSDDFNRADGALGANWETLNGTVEIVSEEAKITAQSTNWGAIRWVTATDGDDQFIELLVKSFGTSSDHRNIYLALRSDSATPMHGAGSVAAYITAYDFQNAMWRIRRKDTGDDFTNLATLSDSAPTPPFTLRFEVEGTDLRLLLNDSLILSASDANFSGADHRLIGIYSNRALNAIYDDFSAGDLAAEPPLAAIAPPTSAQVI